MKIVLPGGTGQVGRLLADTYRERGHEVIVLSRGSKNAKHTLAWDAQSLGPWAAELDGADLVVNLAGRSVNCRYTPENRAAMMSSRVDSTRVVGEAIAQAKRPPRLWLQMSTATIYAHRFDAPNDEATGIIGGSEPDAPSGWKFSIDIAQAWERTLEEAPTPHTRKVALRASVVLGAGRGGIFDVLLGLTRAGLGGTIGDGRQYVSWVHEHDFVSALDFLIARDDMAGAVNIAAPMPLPQREFMAILRAAHGTRIGLPATKWMTALGAFLLRTETELTFKSRRVVPGRLCDAGFVFAYPEWQPAAEELVARWRALRLGDELSAAI